MSLYKNAAKFDVLRSISAASLTGSFAAVGVALPSPAVVLTFKNATNGDVIISTDGVNNMLFLPANSYNVFDIKTNGPILQDYMFKQGTVFYAKDGTTASTSGSFYIEAVIVERL